MSGTYGLFEAVGVELEYMIVDRESLAVRPVADALLEAEAGAPVAEWERGRLAWSNELVLHVLELKTNGPAADLIGLAAAFQGEVQRANQLLSELGAQLMPTGMHPFMDPDTETRLWPHEYNDVYRAFDRIFGCRGHGWANLQSTHLNLPFTDDAEFAALHAAVRAVLPLVPALAASSPFQEGAAGRHLDGRLAAYRGNAARVPSIAGRVIPESVRTRAEYGERILQPIYDDLRPLDPEGVLRHEWVNARGAIARFGRGSIEIRLVDAQESPASDLAVLAAVREAVRWLTTDPPDGAHLGDFGTERLARVLDRTIAQGERATIDDPGYLRLLGAPGDPTTAGALWRHLIDRTLARGTGAGEWAPALEVILNEGTLARRILAAVGPDAGRERVRGTYARLCACLAEGVPFSQRDA